ncbi:MAG: hypothetical protein U5L45_22630 [Saprospiraceae bacterium]|nr:hypothetical protein [Saprospiraceae bacterium]
MGFRGGKCWGSFWTSTTKMGGLLAVTRQLHKAFLRASTRAIGMYSSKMRQKVYKGGKTATEYMQHLKWNLTTACFFNCSTGIEYRYYNYYNEFVHHCEFWQCGYGINAAPLGNVYVEQCHFRNSLLADIRLGMGHESQH